MPNSNPSAYSVYLFQSFFNTLAANAVAFAPGPFGPAAFLGAQYINGQIGESLQQTNSAQLNHVLAQVDFLTSAAFLARLYATGNIPAAAIATALTAAGAGAVIKSAITSAYNNNATVRDLVDSYDTAAGNLLEAAGDWAADVYDALQNQLPFLPSDPSQLVPAIRDFIQDRYGDLSDALNNLYPGAGDGLDNALAALGQALDALDNNIGDLAGALTQSLSDAINDGIDAAAGFFGAALAALSPIVLDMDGDGIELTSLANSHTFFDLNVNGFAEKTGWVTGGDGLLARDLNGNGNIDNNSELFGDNGGTSAYQKLAALDANADGKVDAADAAFASLRLWQDANGNGRTDAGELKTLAEAGIASLNVAYFPLVVAN